MFSKLTAFLLQEEKKVIAKFYSYSLFFFYWMVYFSSCYYCIFRFVMIDTSKNCFIFSFWSLGENCSWKLPLLVLCLDVQDMTQLGHQKNDNSYKAVTLIFTVSIHLERVLCYLFSFKWKKSVTEFANCIDLLMISFCLVSAFNLHRSVPRLLFWMRNFKIFCINENLIFYLIFK